MKSLIAWAIELWYLPERDRSYMNQVQAHFLNFLERCRSYKNQVQAHSFILILKGRYKIPSKDKPSVS